MQRVVVQAADAPLSGLVAMLAAAQILSNGTQAGQGFSARVVFAALAGEPWGAMGSRRLVHDMLQGANSTAGLKLDRVEKVGQLLP